MNIPVDRDIFGSQSNLKTWDIVSRIVLIVSVDEEILASRVVC